MWLMWWLLMSEMSSVVDVVAMMSGMSSLVDMVATDVSDVECS